MASRDNRRYTGPEQTTPIHLLLPRSDTTFLSPSGQRADNRAQLDMRKMCELYLSFVVIIADIILTS